MRFPHLAHRSAAAHKLHSTPQQHRMNLISGSGETVKPAAGYQSLACSSPEAVQTTGTVARNHGSAVAWCPALRRQTRRLEDVRRLLPKVILADLPPLVPQTSWLSVDQQFLLD